MSLREVSVRRTLRARTVLCLVLAIGCTDRTPSGPNASDIVALPPIVDTGAVSSGRLAVSYYPSSGWSHVYTLRPDGTGLTQITPDDQWAVAPAWSPDGDLIAYQRLGTDDVAGIWIVRADGSGSARIAAGGSAPFWLDAARVSFGCATGICVVGADGSSPATLVAHAAPEGTADDSYTLSPDGNTFAFVRRVPSDDVDPSRVYVMNRDGTAERPLTSLFYYDQSFPSWSSDGKRIAFVNGQYDVAVVDADGRSEHGVSQRDAIEPDLDISAPAWSPDGTQLLFGDARRFYIANADGSGAIRRIGGPTAAVSDPGHNSRWSWTSH
jgi:Tol biopolymer transport system component